MKFNYAASVERWVCRDAQATTQTHACKVDTFLPWVTTLLSREHQHRQREVESWNHRIQTTEIEWAALEPDAKEPLSLLFTCRLSSWSKNTNLLLKTCDRSVYNYTCYSQPREILYVWNSQVPISYKLTFCFLEELSWLWQSDPLFLVSVEYIGGVIKRDIIHVKDFPLAFSFVYSPSFIKEIIYFQPSSCEIRN